MNKHHERSFAVSLGFQSIRQIGSFMETNIEQIWIKMTGLSFHVRVIKPVDEMPISDVIKFFA